MYKRHQKVFVTPWEVSTFNASWPCSTLRASRSYWFEFEVNGDLVDTDCPEQDDGPAASAMADDCKAYLLEGTLPMWAQRPIIAVED